jgi:DnaJ family protein C protein 17
MAVENERGNPGNPLKITWLEGTASNSKVNHDSSIDSSSTKVGTPIQVSGENNSANERDFESLVMRKLRQVEERKRLCEELENEDAS